VNAGADFISLTSAYNEAFILACLFSACNPSSAPMGFSSLKCTAKHLLRYVEEQRKCVIGEMAAFLKAERKELFKEWGLADGEARRDAGAFDRDSKGRFLGGHQYGGHALAGPPKRTINDVVNAATRSAISL